MLMVAPSRKYLIIFFQVQSVMIMTWTSEHREFAVEIFFAESLIATHRGFRAHFLLRRNDAVPDRIFNV